MQATPLEMAHSPEVAGLAAIRGRGVPRAFLGAHGVREAGDAHDRRGPLRARSEGHLL